MSSKGFSYLRFGVVPTMIYRHGVYLRFGKNHFLPRRFKFRSDKRIQEYVTTSNNHLLKSHLSPPYNIGIFSQRLMSTSSTVPDNTSNNATIPKYSKESLDPTTYKQYFHDFKCYPKFERYIHKLELRKIFYNKTALRPL